MKTFETGRLYYEVAEWDGDRKWTWKCVARTKCTVTVECLDERPPREGERTVKLKISKTLSEAIGAESCFFSGHYSRCPVLCAAAICDDSEKEGGAK